MDKLPKITLDFIKSAEPQGPSPLEELQDRFAEKKARERGPLFGGALPNPHTHGVEYVVEMRIREWMLRVAAEQRESKRAADAAKDAAKPPQNHHGGNKITPPKP